MIKPHALRKDETGKRYGRLTVVAESPHAHLKPCRWACKCDCGRETIVMGSMLRNGHTQSCGCLEKENLSIIAKSHVKHGLAGTDSHRIWGGMIQRCENPKMKCYPNYGGRGVSVCQRWRESFEAFAQDMGPRPSKRHSIERKDNSKGYEPSNCVWATDIEQANNTRANRIVVVRGMSMTLTQAFREHSVVSFSCLYSRLDNGESIEQALFTPVKSSRKIRTKSL